METDLDGNIIQVSDQIFIPGSSPSPTEKNGGRSADAKISDGSMANLTGFSAAGRENHHRVCSAKEGQQTGAIQECDHRIEDFQLFMICRAKFRLREYFVYAGTRKWKYSGGSSHGIFPPVGGFLMDYYNKEVKISS